MIIKHKKPWEKQKNTNIQKTTIFQESQKPWNNQKTKTNQKKTRITKTLETHKKTWRLLGGPSISQDF